MLYLRILTFLTVFGFINGVNVKFGDETENGHWTTKHRISFSFTIGGRHYFFGLTDKNNGRYWFIQELKEGGKTGPETSQGTWLNNYITVFPFAINDKQFIYGIDDQNYWFIQEISTGGRMGRETDNGFWKSTPKIIFPFSVGGKQYIYSLTDTDWFIIEISPKGNLGRKTGSGSWNNNYVLGFPFSINGKQYFYSVSNIYYDYYWFIQELLPDGIMGVETDNGFWNSNHILYTPFSIDGRHYFYGLDDNKNWFVKELLPGGKMGKNKMQGSWNNYYTLSFAFKINGRQFLYGVSEYYWFIQEIILEPRLPIITTTKEKYCDNFKVIRTKRQNNGSCNIHCGGLNAVEDLGLVIQNDDDNFDTMTFNNPADPTRTVSTFRVFADAYHNRYVDLTALMRAEIHYRHLNPIRDPTISAEVREHLRQMDRENDDEAGHLLASSLGGQGVPYNFAPQSPMLNRAVNVVGSLVPQQDWYAVEETIRDYLIQANANAYVRWTLVPQYLLLPNSRRPTNFLLSVRFYDGPNNLVNWEMEGAVRSYNFYNAPTAACTNDDHPWWNPING